MPGLLNDLPLLDYWVQEKETKLLVSGYRQLDGHSCGPVAAYSVVETFHPGSSYNKIYRDCNPTEEEGAGMTQMLRTLRRNGVGVSVRWNLTFRSICQAIDNGFPIIVGETRNGRGSDHWCVLTGYGVRPNRVFTCNQPNVLALSGRESFTWPEWRSVWNERGMGLVCWGKASKPSNFP